MSHPARSTLEPPDYDGHFIMIPLTQGKFTIVDEADAELVLSMGKWGAEKRPRTYYAGRRAGRDAVLMHAVIAGFKGPDHVNRNGLDNRRVNLRPATGSQNRANTPVPSNNKSGYKGVFWNRRSRKWRAAIGVNGRQVLLGLFDDRVTAAYAYNEAALEAFGEYAWLNPLPPLPDGLGAQLAKMRSATTEQRRAGEAPHSDNKSGYKGVCWHRARGKWTASIYIDGRQASLGYFADPADAARAYNKAALEAWGEYAWLNPVPAAPERADRLPRTIALRLRADGTPRYKGVTWHRARGKWVAYIVIDGRQKHLGCFDDPAEAARAYNQAAIAAWGEAARLNPLPDVTEPPAA